jgi:ABC-type multidrug transport system ATPase subunit
MQLIQVLKKVANAGSSVLFTIHQPSSDVFNSFDRIILMNSGQVMATGEVDEMYSFFSERGQPIPNHYNPADWLMVSLKSIIGYGR